MFNANEKNSTFFLFAKLFQRLSSTVGSAFDEICQSFKHYLLKNYETVKNITGIWWRILDSFYKGSAHIRRSNGRLGRKIVLSLHNPMSLKKGDFLLHKHTKQAFLEILGTQLSAYGISILHSNRYCIQSPNFRKHLSSETSWRRHRPANSSSLALKFITSPICHFTTPCICIPIPVKQLLISRSPSSYSVMSWHSQIFKYIPFVAVIPHQGCILLDHVQYYKNFWKITDSEIYWGSFHYYHRTEKTYCKLERKFYFFY